jgi:hypothetical protein
VSAVRTDWLQRSMLLGGGGVTGLLLAEILLRVAGIGYPVFSRPDDDRGWVLRPGARGRFEGEGGTLVAINRDGLRDRDHSRTKSPGTLRIAVLGDSYAEAAEVSLEQTFWSVLERDLNRSVGGHGRQVEVLNFGVRGYGSVQELLTLRCCVWDSAPDVVLLAFYSGNDVSDNSPTLDRSTTQYARPYLEPTSRGWSVDRSFRRDWRFRTAKLVAPFVAGSRVLQLVIHAQHILLHHRSSSRATATGAQVGTELGLDFRLYQEPVDESWKGAWSATEALLTMIARDVSDHGARFAVVCVTNPIQVYPDPTVRERFARHLGVSDLLLPNRRIRALGEREGFPVLDLTPDLQAYADRHRAFLHSSTNAGVGVGHWNALGHRLAGEAIAAWMAGWIGDSPALVSGPRGP